MNQEAARMGEKQTRYPQLYVGEFTALAISKDGIGYSVNAEELYTLMRDYVCGNSHAQLRCAELEKALRVAEDALVRCYDVTEWPGPGAESTQASALVVVRAALASQGEGR